MSFRIRIRTRMGRIVLSGCMYLQWFVRAYGAAAPYGVSPRSNLHSQTARLIKQISTPEDLRLSYKTQNGILAPFDQRPPKYCLDPMKFMRLFA